VAARYILVLRAWNLSPWIARSSMPTVHTHTHKDNNTNTLTCSAVSQYATVTFLTRTWLCYVRILAIANPPVVCNVRASYSGGSSPNDLLCVEWDVKPYTLTHSLLRRLRFLAIFFTVLYLSHPFTSTQSFTEIVPWEPLHQAC